MSAQVVHLRIASTTDRRRADTIRDMAVALAATELATRATLPTLGNREAYLLAMALRDKLDNQVARFETLADEFRELAEADEAENTE